MCFVIFVSVLWTLSNVFISCSCIDILVWPLPHSNPAGSLWSVFPLIFFQPCIGWWQGICLRRLGQVRVSAGLLTHLHLIAGTRMGTNRTSWGFKPGEMMYETLSQSLLSYPQGNETLPTVLCMFNLKDIETHRTSQMSAITKII